MFTEGIGLNLYELAGLARGWAAEVPTFAIDGDGMASGAIRTCIGPPFLAVAGSSSRWRTLPS